MFQNSYYLLQFSSIASFIDNGLNTAPSGVLSGNAINKRHTALLRLPTTVAVIFFHDFSPSYTIKSKKALKLKYNTKAQALKAINPTI